MVLSQVFDCLFVFLIYITNCFNKYFFVMLNRAYSSLVVCISLFRELCVITLWADFQKRFSAQPRKIHHFHPLTNIKIFTCNFACEITISHIFNCTVCIYKADTRWDLPPYWITTRLIDDGMLICFFTWRFSFRIFITAIWHRKPVDLKSHQPSPL